MRIFKQLFESKEEKTLRLTEQAERKAEAQLKRLAEKARQTVCFRCKRSSTAIEHEGKIWCSHCNDWLLSEKVGQELEARQVWLRAESDRYLRDLGERLATSDDEKVLRQLCGAYAQNDRDTIEQLEPKARLIGEELDRRGGLEEMRRMFDQLRGMQGSRTLEMHWNGIGDWRG